MRKNYTDKDLYKIGTEYLSGKTYKELMADGYSKWGIAKAVNFVSKEWNMKTVQIDLKSIVSLSHHQGGIISQAQLKKHSSYTNLNYPWYRVRLMSLDELIEIYGEDYVNDLLANNEYVPIILEGTV